MKAVEGDSTKGLIDEGRTCFGGITAAYSENAVKQVGPAGLWGNVPIFLFFLA